MTPRNATLTPEPSPYTFAVRLREQGEARHMLLGVKCLTNRWMRAVGFPTLDEARQAAEWMLQHNDDIASAQVVTFRSGRVVLKVAR